LKIDKLHLQLLEILAQNCRISHTSLGKALRISRDTVTYRIKQLEESGVLSSYVLFIDARRLGFTRYHILIRLQQSAVPEKLYADLAGHEFVMWINSFVGCYDLQVIVDATDGFHLNQIREEIFAICKHEIRDYIILTHLADLEFTQLNPILDFGTSFEQNSDYSFGAELTTRNFPVQPQFKKVRVSRLDLEILQSLAKDPRKSLVEIADDAKCERQTAKRRIDRLIEKKVILSFGAVSNLLELGFVSYYLLVRLVQDTSYTEMREPFLELNNIFYAGQMIGDYDMILYLNARNPKELESSIRLLRNRLQDRIINYDLLIQDRVHHWKQFTSGIYASLKKT